MYVCAAHVVVYCTLRQVETTRGPLPSAGLYATRGRPMQASGWRSRNRRLARSTFSLPFWGYCMSLMWPDNELTGCMVKSQPSKCLSVGELPGLQPRDRHYTSLESMLAFAVHGIPVINFVERTRLGLRVFDGRIVKRLTCRNTDGRR